VHRPNLNDLSPGDRTQLAQMIQQYVTPAIVGQHLFPPPGIHSDGSIFLSWHRVYVAGLENFVVQQGHPEWSPLPAWNPAESIPDEFNIPNQGPGALQNLNPNISFSPEFDPENLGNFENDEELGMELMMSPFHNSVHVAVGGVMATFRSPEAPIFWPWHSFIDDIWWTWQRLTVITPNCLGLTRVRARQLLISMGLVEGRIIRHPGPGTQPGRRVVMDQAPDAGDRVVQGTAVDLVIGRL
jgi:Common central domain of tyrosinase